MKILAVWLWCVAALAGCVPQGPPEMGLIHAAYQEGHYAEASRQALEIMRLGPTHYKGEAAYIVGLIAYRSKDAGAARQHFLYAANSPDPALSADALVMLGLIDAERGMHETAARAFLDASRLLAPGKERASAYYHAAKAQQKLGHWAQARTSLSLARSNSDNLVFRDSVTQELAATGFTLQTGAFVNQANALVAAEALTLQAAKYNLGRPRLLPAVDRNGRKLFLVQVGQFSSYDSALAARGKLGQATAMITMLSTGH